MYKITEQQKQIIGIEKVFENSSINTLGIVVDFKLPYSFKKVNDVLNNTVKDIDAFQLRYSEIDHIIYQSFESFQYENFPQIDFSFKEQEYEEFINIHMGKCYFKKGEKLYEIYVIKKPSGRMAFALFLHHSISDAWSLTQIFSEKICQYIIGRTTDEDNDESFEEYLKNSLAEKKNPIRIQRNEQYWHDRLDNYTGINQYHKTSSVKELVSKRSSFLLSMEESEKIMEGSENCGVSLPVLFLSSLILLKSYDNQSESFSIGLANLGRKTRKERKIFGGFVRLLPLIVKINRHMGVKEFILEIKRQQMNLFKHQDYSYSDILDYVHEELKEDVDLLEIGYSFQNAIYDDESTAIAGNIEWLNSNDQNIPLTVHVSDRSKEKKLSLDYDYRISLFSEMDIERMHHRLVHIAKQLIVAFNESDLVLADIDVLPTLERDRILYEFNSSGGHIVRNESIVSVFKEQVNKFPNKTAVIYKEEKITYEELNHRADQIATILKERGLKTNELVAIIANRSIEMVISILGVLKSGAAYVPMDPGYPVSRIEFMLEDSKPKAILCAGKVDYSDIMQVNLKDKNLFQNTVEEVKDEVKPDDLAYVIYTSGTTGKPKGVMIEHHSVVNLSKHHGKYYGITHEDKILQFANISFDASVWEFIMALLHGGTLVLVDEETIENFQMFNNYIKDMGVTVATLPPQYFLQTQLDSLRLIITAGSESSQGVLKHVAKGTDYVNAYGPTEGTVCASDHMVCSDEVAVTGSVSIGKPILNSQLYILQNMNLCGINIQGELCIAGEGVGRGYLNRDDLTKEKFIDNPFGKGKLYRTGDLAKWLPDGNIEYVSRIDDQVKIRGYRIELGEIESFFRNQEAVKDIAVVANKNHEGENELYAFIVLEEGLWEIEIAKLRKEIGESLPWYMYPNWWNEVKKIPMTRNGKVDTKSLLSMKSEIDHEYVEPTTSTEKSLCEIYKALLNIDKIGKTDNFFNLGGHSLLAMKLVNFIDERMEKHITVKNIFEYPIIKDLASCIDLLYVKTFEPIPLAKISSTYPMSSAQKRLFMVQQMNPETTSYNMPFGLEVKGKFNIELLSETLKNLIERHEILRTSFYAEGKNFIQKIHEHVVPDINVLDYSSKSNETDITRTFSNEKILEEFVGLFDLGKAPLMRIKLIKLSEDHGYILFDTHHIISDAVSMKIFMEEFIAIYNGEKLKELTVQYKDYSEWQILKDISPQAEYWNEFYEIPVHTLDLPYDSPRPRIKSFAGDLVTFELEVILIDRIRDFAKINDMTEYMVLLGGLMITLHQYSRQDDIVIGSPIVGRTHGDTERMLGMFVNTLAMRGYPESDKSLEQFFSEIRNHCLGAYENQEYPFEELVDRVIKKGDLSRNPLFDVSFALQNYEDVIFGFKDMEVKEVFNNQHLAKFDIDMQVLFKDGKYQLDCIYNTDLFKKQSIEGMINHFTQVLSVMTEDIKQNIGQLSSLTDNERHKITKVFNTSEINYNNDLNVKEIFEEVVNKNPHKTALVYEDESLSYEKLNKKSNQLARRLLELGVKKEEPVVILSERSLELMIGILAILKAGACYVPIDSTYPKERIDYILDDVNAKIILCGDVDYSENKDLLMIKLKDSSSYEGDDANTDITLRGDNLAYIIYTSGTSGKPNGSLIEHKSIIRLVKDCNYFSFHEGVNILQTGSVAFDASTFEYYGSLLNGGTLYLVSQDTLVDVYKLSEAIKKNGINTLWMTSTLFNQMLDLRGEMFGCLDYLLVGGERLSDRHIRKFKEMYPHIKVINGYGPTENTTFTTTCEIPDNFEIIPIGKPISGTQVYVMDKDKLCGVGMPGELCITGIGLSRGYLNREELTKEKFVKNPFGEGRMYHTGDLVRWLPDGNIDYLGRIDEQVKIRGYRVELKEIEEVLSKQEGVKDSVVIAKQVGEGDKALFAYIIMKEVQDLDVLKLKEGLRKVLPEYMVPQHFKDIDKMPLTINGKIDRRALPDIEYIREYVYVAPVNKEEKLLVEAFEQVLSLKKISTEDSFFELGGDSIKAIHVSSIMRDKGYNLNIRDIMKFQTVGKICTIGVMVENVEEYKQEPISGEVPLSPIQRRFFKLDLKNKHHFNQSILLEIDSPLNGEILKKSLKEIVVHHDMLRAVYDTNQRIKSIDEVEETVVFKEIFLKDITEEKINEEIEKIIRKDQGTMDILNGPLLHAVLFHTISRDYLMICIHHLAVDGVSFRILIMDLFTAYDQVQKGEKINLPNKTASYLDWVKSLKEFGESSDARNDEKYWRAIASSVKTSDKLFAKPIVQKQEEGRMGMGLSSFSFPKGIFTSMLKEYNKIFGIETNEILITALSIALYNWKNVSSYVLEVETHGREELHKKIDINRTVGWFTNLFPLVLNTKSNIYDTIMEVKRSFLRVPNQGMTYGILKYLNHDKLLNLYAEVCFNFLGDTSMTSNMLTGIRYCDKFRRFDMDSKNVLFHPLSINGMYVRDKVIFMNQYDNSFISKEDMDEFQESFIDALNRLNDFAHSDLISKERVNIVEEVSDIDFSNVELDLLNQLMEGMAVK